MDIATAHQSAREAACRIPALNASLALLAQNTQAAQVDIYAGALPATPGATPPGALLVSIPMSAGAGSVDEALFQLRLSVPIEAQISGAGAGTDATWGRILDGSGNWWADVSVSASGGGGELQLANITLADGDYARITSGVFQG